MNLAAFAGAPCVIQLHLLLAVAALVLGGVQLAMPKGSRRHQLTGYLWVSFMTLVALSSFFIFELRIMGPFSPIHLLSVFTLYALYSAVRAARQNNIKRHKQMMVLLYGLGLVLTGGFTLMPGRLMHAILLGGPAG